MKKMSLLVAVLLCAAMLMTACGKGGDGTKSPAETAGYMKVSLMTGKAEVRLSGGAYRVARVGMMLRESDVVRTVGVNSSCSLSTPGGSVIRLGGDSLLVMKKLYRDGKINVEKTGLELLAGKVIVKAKKLFNKESFTVRTKSATAGVRGTQFVVAIDKENNTSVGVKSGRVLVSRKLVDADKNVDKVVRKIAAENKVLLAPDQQVVIKNRDNNSIVAATRKEMKVVRAKGVKASEVADVIRKVKRTVLKKQVRVRLQGFRFNYRTDTRLKKDFEELERVKPVSEKKKPDVKKRVVGGRRSGAHTRQPDASNGENALGKKQQEELRMKQDEERKRKAAERKRLLEARRRKFQAEQLKAMDKEKALRNRRTRDDRE